MQGLCISSSQLFNFHLVFPNAHILAQALASLGWLESTFPMTLVLFSVSVDHRITHTDSTSAETGEGTAAAEYQSSREYEQHAQFFFQKITPFFLLQFLTFSFLDVCLVFPPTFVLLLAELCNKSTWHSHQSTHVKKLFCTRYLCHVAGWLYQARETGANSSKSSL